MGTDTSIHFLQGARKIDHLSIKEDEEEKDESDVLIECRDIYKSFGEKHILRGVNFKVIFIFMLVIYSIFNIKMYT